MQNMNPLLVFIHVPKTAGSTVNDYLVRSGKIGKTHVEAWIGDQNATPLNLASLDWVSGHVPFRHMRARLSSHTSRHFRFFTLVRDPIKQLMSHYNWLIEIYHRGGKFYDEHPARIKEISESIRSTDNNDPACVISQLEASPGLFLNQQSRLVFGELPLSLSNHELTERLRVYECIATEKTLPDFISRISGLSYDPEKRENVSPYHFDKSVFESRLVRDFVERKHAVDLALYQFLTDMEGG